MADGDIIHNKLSWRYQRAYKELCEWDLDRNECAWVVMGAVMRDLKKKGNAPVRLAKRMGERLEQVLGDGSENSSRNWGALNVELHRLARQVQCSHYDKEIVLRAGKGILHDLRYDRRVNASNLSEICVKRYMQEVYKSNFEDRIPLTPNHYADVDHVTLTKRVEIIHPDLVVAIGKWAQKANANEDVTNLRRPKRQIVKEIDAAFMGEDLR